MERLLFDQTMAITIPDEFEELPEEMAEKIYTTENRPQIIETTKDRKIHITMSNTEMEIDHCYLKQILDMSVANLKRMNPAYEFFDQQMAKSQNVEYVWFDFKGFSFDGELYYLNAIALIHNKMHHISFMCPIEMKTEKKELFLNILNGMKDMTRI